MICQASVTAQAISTELQQAQLQRDKLALELEVFKLCAAAVETKVADGAESSKPGATRKKRTIDSPHEFCSGAPTLDFEKLELANFVAGFLKMIQPYEGTCKEVMLELLELLMLKASSYTWKSVRGFYAQCKACAVSGTILVLARAIRPGRPIQGITNVEFVKETILCYIVLSDVLPSLKFTSILRSHRDS